MPVLISPNTTYISLVLHDVPIGRITQIIVSYLIMKTVGMNRFYNAYWLILFGFCKRTKYPFKHIHLIGKAGSNELAPLSCVRTQLVLLPIV